jgi:hypothetical protein
MNVLQFIIKILPSAVEVVKIIFQKKSKKEENGNQTN